MEIEYELIVADVAALLRFQLRHRPKGKQLPVVYVARVVLAAAAVIMAGLSVWFFWQPKGAWSSGCCAGVVIGFWSFCVVDGWLRAETLIPNTIRLYYDTDEARWYFARRRMRIASSGFEITNEFHQDRYSWPVVWLIGSTDKHIFLCIRRGAAIIVPRRAFRDTTHFEEFLALARQYQQEKEQQKSKPTGIIAGLPPQSGAITRSDVS